MPRVVCAIAFVLSLGASGADAQAILSPIRYDLDFDLDYDQDILRATAALTLENSSTQPVKEVSLLLYRLLSAKTVRGENGADVPFRQTIVAFEDLGKQQANQVIVSLPAPLAPGAQTTLRIAYEGYLLGYAETGMLYVRDRIDRNFTILRQDSLAYPQPGVPSYERNRRAGLREFTYKARVTVPTGLTVANGGRLDGADAAGGRTTFRFSSLKPSWRMDFAIAEYGQLSSGSVRVYYFPADKDGATGVADAAARSLELFGR